MLSAEKVRTLSLTSLQTVLLSGHSFSNSVSYFTRLCPVEAMSDHDRDEWKLQS